MDWLQEHLGSMEYLGDFYIPKPGGGSGKAKTKHIAGSEQIKQKNKDYEPTIIETDKHDFPRIQKFFEWEQFLDYIDWSGSEYRRRSHWTGQNAYEHTLTRNFQEAMDLARYGWREGLEKVQKLDKIDFPVLQTIQQNYDIQTRYDIAGGAVNIGRYLSGAPDCMRRMCVSNEHSLPARIQKVFVIGDFEFHKSADEFLRHGYKVYQIINALEMFNIQTEIILAFGSNKRVMYTVNDYDFYETYIKIKNTEDIIYPEKMLFCVAHPSMFRRLVFSEYEKNSRYIIKKFHFYYDIDEFGYARHIADWLPPYPMLRDALVIPNLDHTDKMEDVMKKVKNLIQSQYERIK